MHACMQGPMHAPDLPPLLPVLTLLPPHTAIIPFLPMDVCFDQSSLHPLPLPSHGMPDFQVVCARRVPTHQHRPRPDAICSSLSSSSSISKRKRMLCAIRSAALLVPQPFSLETS